MSRTTATIRRLGRDEFCRVLEACEAMQSLWDGGLRSKPSKGTQVEMAYRYFDQALVDKVEAVLVNSSKEDEATYMGMMDLFQQQFAIVNPLFLRQSAFMKGDTQEGEKLSSYCARAKQESIGSQMEEVTYDNLLTIKIMSAMKEPLKSQIFRELGGVVKEK